MIYLKVYRIEVNITDREIPIDDPVTEMIVPTLGFKMNIKGKEYGTVMICTDKNKLEVIPHYLKEYLEMIINE